MSKDTEPTIVSIGKYSVLDVIGAGGMGVVYRARDAALNRTVAIKMLKRSAGTEAQAAQVEKFFKRELLATASLQHRNIVTVYESGEQNGDPYLVMEYLEGEPVSHIIAERRPMPLVDKLDILVQVCEGLQYAHDRKPQVIHRDIKPANVILLKDGTAKLVDFGIARIAGAETSVTQTGQLVGSVSYMSPEQINSMALDTRTDIFSAGVLAYELVAYALPFKAGDPGSTFVKILREDPEPLRNYVPDVPAELEEAILHALAKKPQDRYQTAEEFGFDLLSLQRKLKQGMSAEFMQRAEAAVERGELERAKQLLLEITRLDRHHDRANRLLAAVRKAIQHRERAAQVVQMRSQAQVALAGQQYEEALACVEQAIQLDPSDAASLALRDEISSAVALHKNVREKLGHAESAMLAGDLEEARIAVQQALVYDPENAEARALAAMIEKEVAERIRRAQVQHLVDSARDGISRRQFEEAIQSLRQAEGLDPTDSNVRELMQWATRGKEQELRRKELLDLTEEIDRAMRGEDFSSAFTICELALGKFPNEPTILRLRAIAERQKGIAERRQFVHDQSLAARDLMEAGDVSGAIAILDSGLAKIPAEPNFQALLSEAQKMQRDREAFVERATHEETNAQAMHLHLQRATEECGNLQKALDDREPIELLELLATNLSKMLNSIGVDEQTRRMGDPLLEQVRMRVEARQQLVSELAELKASLARSPDMALRSRAAGRLVEAKAAFPRERDIRAACDEISKLIESAKGDRARVVSELSRIAEGVTRVSMEQAQEVMDRCDALAAPYSTDPQVGALVQQIHFEIERRQKRLEARVREIGNLESAIAEAASLESISQLLQNAISISSPDAEEPVVVAAVQSVRRAGDARRRAISELQNEIEQITNRVLVARSVDDAEQLLAEAKAQAAKYPNIEEIQRKIVRVAAQVRGRRVEHDLVRGELEALVKSAHDNASVAELESIGRRALEVHDKYPQERTLIALCKDVDLAVESAKEKFLQAEIARVREEEQRLSAQPMVNPEVAASSVRRLQDLVQAYPDNVELRSALLKAQEMYARADRAQRETSARERFERATGTHSATAIQAPPAEVKSKSSKPLIIGLALGGVVVVASAIGWFSTHRSTLSSFTLRVETSPPEATVQVNGQTCTSRPCVITLPANATYEATADLAGYVSAAKTGVLNHSDSVVLELTKSVPQPAVAASTELSHPGHLVINGMHPGDRLIVDQAPMPRPAKGGWALDPGVHHLKLMDGNQELVADPRQIAPGATVTLNRSDFRAPAPLTSDEQVAWNRVQKNPDVATISDFLNRYPNSPQREEASSKLENLYWTKASGTGTVAAYRDYLARYSSPPGAHFDAANAAIDQLQWQSLQNSSDVNQLGAFLAAHPKGPYHQLAADRLDDLAWNTAKAADTADGARTYLREFPAGRHRDEANNQIAQLTPKAPAVKPAEEAANHPPAAPTPTPRAEDDATAIHRVLDAYQDAYQSRSIEKLRAIWPTMSASQTDGVQSLFKNNSDIQAPYIIGRENISGDRARVAITQFLSLGGKKATAAKMTILLSKNPGEGSWSITAIQ